MDFIARSLAVRTERALRAAACAAGALGKGALRRFASMLGDTRGVAAIEFAFVLPMLTAFIVPIADLGYRAYINLQVQTAVQAGAHYALIYGWNSAKIATAVTNATNWSGIGASPAPAKSCGCPNGTVIVVAACGDTCPDGNSAGTYVTVSAQTDFQPIIPMPVVGVAGTISAQATVRVQ